MEEKKFIGRIPPKEYGYLMHLDKFSSPYISKDGFPQSSEDDEKHIIYMNELCNLQHIASTYGEALETLGYIDEECYPEIYELQEKVCDLLVKAYYEEKDIYYNSLGHLDIYNPDIKDMSPRDGMIPIL